ncbi:MAG: alpha/beta hydrolase family protein [Phenylobacterium sp.]
MFSRRRLLQAAPALAFPGRSEPAVRTLDRIDLVDPARGRTIPTRIHMPAAPGPWPVILFSHGFGGSLSAFGETGRYWAARGMVVIHPTHTDSVQVPDPTLPAEDARAVRQALAAAIGGRPGGPPLTEVMERPIFLRSRLADIAFLQSLMRARDTRLPASVRDRIDPARMGMAGHSFGAYLTLVLCGARLSPEPPPPLPAGFRAGMAISGQGSGRLGLKAGAFDRMALPLFSVTGSRDFGAAEETPDWRLEAFRSARPGRQYAAILDGFRHGDFDAPESDPVLGKPVGRLRALQSAFWRATLTGDTSGWADLDRAAGASRAGYPLEVRRR